MRVQTDKNAKVILGHVNFILTKTPIYCRYTMGRGRS